MPAIPNEVRAAGAKHERVLKAWEIKYDYIPNLPIDALRNRTSTQVRVGEEIVDRDKARRFQMQADEGAIFGPITVAKISPKFFNPIDGNHRIAAWRLRHLDTIPAFVTPQLADEVADTIGAFLNQTEGNSLTADQIAFHARRAIQLGWEDEAIAAFLGRNRSRINVLRNEYEFTKRIANCGNINLNGTTLGASTAIEVINRRIPQKRRVRLNQIANDPALFEATRLVYEVSLKDDDFSDLIFSINSARTETAAVEAVQTKRSTLAPVGFGDRKVPSRGTRGMGPIGDFYGIVRKITLNYRGKEHEVVDTVHPERRKEYEVARDVLDEVLRLWESK